MIYFHIVMEVIQKRAPERSMVIIPGTHPRTLKDHDWAIMAKHT
jgi:hypothetical protein